MGQQQHNRIAEDVSSTMRWWRDAGVDVMIDELPRNWLVQSVAAAHLEAVAAAAPQRPQTLAALVDWLMASGDAPEAGPPRRRVPPSGDPASGLMVLTDLPDSADIESQTLLSGELAPLFDKMLAALGRDRGSVYVASLSAGRPPSGRLSDVALAALTPLARDHVGFAAPKKLWLLGASASRAILGMNDFAAHGQLHIVNLDGLMIDTVATAHPRLLDTREKKARAWADMQRLIEKEV